MRSSFYLEINKYIKYKNIELLDINETFNAETKNKAEYYFDTEDEDEINTGGEKEYETLFLENPIFIELYNPSYDSPIAGEREKYIFMYISKSSSLFALLKYFLLIFNYFEDITLIKCHNNNNKH